MLFYLSYSPKLSFKTTRDRSMSSLLSIGSQRTPKIARKSSSSANTSTNSGSSNSSLPKNEKTVTIRCQRLNPNKNNTMEEVDVEVAAFSKYRFMKNYSPSVFFIFCQKILLVFLGACSNI